MDGASWDPLSVPVSHHPFVDGDMDSGAEESYRYHENGTMRMDSSDRLVGSTSCDSESWSELSSGSESWSDLSAGSGLESDGLESGGSESWFASRGSGLESGGSQSGGSESWFDSSGTNYMFAFYDGSGQARPGSDGGLDDDRASSAVPLPHPPPAQTPLERHMPAGRPHLASGGACPVAAVPESPATSTECPVCRRDCRAKHRVGQFWKHYGYGGPPYCNRCANLFRAHMLTEQGVHEKKCSRRVPCPICKEVLSHFACPIDEARKLAEAQADSKKRKRGNEKTARLTATQAATKGETCGAICSVCNKTSEAELGVHWQKIGYAGPPYCKLCSQAFRNHIIRQRNAKIDCSREAPCSQCCTILSWCHQDREAVYQSVDRMQQAREAIAMKRARQLSPTKARAPTKCATTLPGGLALSVTLVAWIGVAWIFSTPAQQHTGDVVPMPQADSLPDTVRCGWSMGMVGRNIDAASLDNCVGQGPVPIGTACNYTCQVDSTEADGMWKYAYVPFGDMTCQRSWELGADDFTFAGGYCRLPMQRINLMYRMYIDPASPLHDDDVSFKEAWTHEFQFVGNQSCGGRWLTGECWCNGALDSDDSAPLHVHVGGSCQTVETCEKQQHSLGTAVFGLNSGACSPWREPATLRMLRDDLLELNLGALLHIYLATGLDYSDIRDSQLLENICGTDMPPLGVAGFGDILAVPPSDNADPLSECPKAGLLRPNANLSIPIGEHPMHAEDIDPKHENDIAEAVRLLGLHLLIPRIVCAAGQNLMDEQGHFLSKAKAIPLPQSLVDELLC